MKHQIRGSKLNRDIHERQALFKSLIGHLMVRGEIKTTEAKAKAIKPLAEKLITKGKKGTLASRRMIAAFLQDKVIVNRVVDEIAPLFKSRPGGFTRIIRLGQRRGDDTMMVRLELVEKPAKKEAPKKEVATPKKKVVASKKTEKKNVAKK